MIYIRLNIKRRKNQKALSEKWFMRFIDNSEGEGNIGDVYPTETGPNFLNG